MAMMPSPGGPPRWPPPPGGLSVDPELRIWSASAPSGGPSSTAEALEAVLEEFTRRWDRGDRPTAEQYLDRLPASDPEAPLELIYHEFCLLASSGRRPPPEEFAGRFPEYRERLLRLIALHEALPSFGGAEQPFGSPLKPGDEVGPYRLLRELGRGGFARVYLAADAELEDRLLVVKVTDRPSAEHRYLARAPHPHIVPILRERTTDDGLQLIFMPFVGGATLGDVLAEARRRTRAPERGLDLLADLDLCSAPEYAAAAPVRPAREILASLSYAQAIAWILARLAEALDHAYRRGVTHGDLKPSNILIGGDGQPMLLDFNLSTDWRPASPDRASGEAGGTLAYMPPERLLALAEPEAATAPCPASRHRADIYALGLILREALSGSPPEIPNVEGSPRSGRALAAILAARRAGGDHSERRQLVAVPPGLRAILRRCLAPDPSDRYPFAAQLAADLDHWRAGLPLLHTRPPAWVELRRWLRYHRRPLIGAACCVALGLIATAAAAKVQEGRQGYQRRLDAADDALDETERQAYVRIATAPDSGARELFAFRSSGMNPRRVGIEFSERLLEDYGLMSSDEDFWDRERLLRLDEPLRSDARALILEHALRLGTEVARAEYDAFPEDRRRAVDVLDRILRYHDVEPLDSTAALLRDQLGGASRGPRIAARRTPPRWLLSYLSGIRAELLRAAEADALGIDRGQIGYPAAISHYRAALLDRPDLYRPRLRLAMASFRIGDFEAANSAYRDCLDTFPESSILWLSLGATDYYLGRPELAVSHLRNSVRIAPQWSAGWHALALLGAQLKRKDLVEESVGHLRLGARRGATEDWRRLRLGLATIHGGADAPIAGVDPASVAALLDREAEDDLTEPDLRARIARDMANAGRLDDAVEQFNRILAVEPDHVFSRFSRAVVLQRLGRSREAMQDYRATIENPNLDPFMQQEPTALMAFVLLSADQFRNGKTDEAIRLAGIASDYADRLDRYRGEGHYARARAFAVASDSDPTLLTRAAEALARARSHHPGFVERRFHTDPAFEGKRAEVASRLGGIEF